MTIADWKKATNDHFRATAQKHQPERHAMLRREGAPEKAFSWDTLTRKRVKLLFMYESPKNAAEFVRLFSEIFGPDSLPYFWVNSATPKKGHWRTMFPARFGSFAPEDAGLVGYTMEEEQRRISFLKGLFPPRVRAAKAGK